MFISVTMKYYLVMFKLFFYLKF